MNAIRSITILASAWSCVLSATGVAGAQDPASLQRRRTPVVEAYERVRDSVVNISATEKVIVERYGVNLFGDLLAVPSERNQRSVGSGFVLHEDGYIVTNAHVASAGSDLTVTLPDGHVFDAHIIGRDSIRDLAVLKVDDAGPLKPIELGRSDDLMIGEQTIAIGNPVGLHNTVTTGVVSALHRDLDVGGHVIYRDVIQTDASINPGNSGGPLVNVLGELIGINTAIRTDAQNIGFAIPVDQLRELLPDILDSEKLSRLQVGMRVSGAPFPIVTGLRKNSPADRAGVRIGDIVTAVDSRTVRRAVDFYVALLNRRPGETVTLDLQRDGRPAEVRLTLDPQVAPDGGKLALARLGLVLADPRDKTVSQYLADRRSVARGVIIVAVEPGSPAAKASLRPGDLLVSMGPHWLTNVDHIGTLLGGASAGEPVDIGFRRVRRGRMYDGEVRLHAR